MNCVQFLFHKCQFFSTFFQHQNLNMSSPSIAYLPINQYLFHHSLSRIYSQTIAYLPIHQYLSQHLDFFLDNSVSANYSIPLSKSFVKYFLWDNGVVTTASFLSPNALLTLSFDYMLYYPLKFLSNLVDSRHMLITLMV